MQKQAKEIRYFFYSQAFADGFRAAFAILIPALLGYHLGFFDIGLTLSLGAMCVSLTDAPGPVIHRRNGMLICTGFIFLVALMTSFARLNIYTMALEIAAVCFFFSMFNVYSNRAASVGSAAILVMILSMDNPVRSLSPLIHAVLILGGGIFYTAFSLLLHFIRPYRIAQRTLGECIREIASYLSVKGDFYNTQTDLDEDYKKMVAQQIVVNEKQDAVRELFFKTRQIVEETTREGRKLVFTFVETVDLFEDITAAYYDYALLRKQFAHTGALEMIHKSLKKIAAELDAIGIAIQTNTSFHTTFDYTEEIKYLKAEIDRIAPKGQYNTVVLRKILVNIRKLLGDLDHINKYFEKDVKKSVRLEHSHFISHQSLDPKIVLNNLSMESSVFRHSLRVCIACVVGFALARIIDYGNYSYWILLTIAFILKPAFSLTRQRNVERIIGTLVGGLAGVVILLWVPNTTALFVFMVVFMIGTYSFLRINYLMMVICTTPYVLILFSFLGNGYTDVVQERIFDTVLGCAIAFSASYFLFPKWESGELGKYMLDMLKANAGYLHKVVQGLEGQKFDMLQYKLARKEVYLHSANLSAAFQRMLSEPKSKQKGEKHIHQFVVLNHILFSNIASVATTLLSKEPGAYPAEIVHTAEKAFITLHNSAAKLSEEEKTSVAPAHRIHNSETVTTTDEALMKEQLNFINQVSADIHKTTKAIIAS